MPPITSYRAPFAPPRWIAVLGAVTITGTLVVPLFVPTGPGDRAPGRLALGVLLFAFCVCCVWVGFVKYAIKLRITDASLVAESYLRTVTIPFDALRYVGDLFPILSSLSAWQAVRIVRADGPSVLIYAGRSFRAFIDELSTRAPALQVDAKSAAGWR